MQQTRTHPTGLYFAWPCPSFPILLIDRLQEVQDLVDVSLLHLQQVGQPATLIAVAHC